MDILKACAFFKTNKLPDYVGIADEIDLDLDTIGKLFGLKIHFFDESHHVSQSDGPEIFMRYKYDKLLFHTNPAKITNLPSGLNKIKGAKFKICDIIGISDDESAMTLEDVERMENKYGVTFEIWEKKNLRLNKPVVKKIKSGNISVHHDTVTGILFLITDRKTYFRCNLNKCKKLYIDLLSKVKVQRIVKVCSNFSLFKFCSFTVANFVWSSLASCVETRASKFNTISNELN